LLERDYCLRKKKEIPHTRTRKAGKEFLSRDGKKRRKKGVREKQKVNVSSEKAKGTAS